MHVRNASETYTDSKHLHVDSAMISLFHCFSIGAIFHDNPSFHPSRATIRSNMSWTRNI